MTLITYQPREVVNQLHDKGILFKDFDIKPNINSDIYTGNKLYREFFRVCQEHSGIDFSKGAFWAYKQQICSVVPSDDNIIKLILDVPDELVCLSHYYNWCDCIHYSLFEEDEYALQVSWDYVFKHDPEVDIQAIIPYLKREWIREEICTNG